MEESKIVTTIEKALDPSNTNPIKLVKNGKYNIRYDANVSINGNSTKYVFLLITMNSTKYDAIIYQRGYVNEIYTECKNDHKKFFVIPHDKKNIVDLGDEVLPFIEIAGDMTKYQVYGSKVSFTINHNYLERNYWDNSNLPEVPYTDDSYAKGSNSKDEYYVTYVPVVDENGAQNLEMLTQYLLSYDSRPNSKYVVNTVDHQFVNYNPAPQPDTSDWPKNFIIAGAPGTGKSYMLNQKAEEKAIEQLVECAKTSSDAKAKDLADTYESVQHLYHTINEIICLKNKKDSEDKENGEYDANDNDITTKIGKYNQSCDEIKDKIKNLSLKDPDEDADNNYKNELDEIKKKLEDIKKADLHIKNDEEGSLKEKSDDIKDLGGIIVELIIEKALKISPECYYKYKKTIRRVTFYEDYAYENFVGCYKPEPTEAENEYNLSVNGSGNYSVSGKSKTHQVTYKYMPGPFLETYIDAMNYPDHEYILIIEEINRAKAASVFGDVFQLLDRGEDGVSVYAITPDNDLDVYLNSHLKKYNHEMKIPGNMYIWATMNNADQGVFPLDSAFKRRWGYLYLDVNSSVNDKHEKIKLGTNLEVNWDDFRQKLNDKILEATDGAEDKCIGAWYFSDEEFAQINKYFGEKDTDKRTYMVNPLCDKLITYLRNDVFRYDPTSLFKADCVNMPKIRLTLRTDGDGLKNVFNWKDSVWDEIKA